MDINKKEKLIESFTGYGFEKIMKKKFPNHLKLFQSDDKIEVDENLKKKMDKRDPNQYVKELIYAWILEDYISYRFSNDFILLMKNGCDKERNVLKDNQVKSSEDILCKIGDKEIYIEIVSDFGSFWKKTQKAHFRDNKIINLINKSKKIDVYIMFVDVVSNKVGLLKVDELLKYKRIDSHYGYGGKPACEITVPSLKEINLFSLSHEFKNYLN